MKLYYLVVPVLVLCACHHAGAGGPSAAAVGSPSVGDSLSIALQAVGTRIVADPGNAALYAERAQLLMNMDSTRRAVNDMERALQLDSTNVQYQLMMGDLYYANVKLDKALQHFKRASALDPRNTAAILKLAEIELVQRNYQPSMDLVNNALRLDVNTAHAYYLKGWIYMETHDTALAISSFHTAVEQDNTDYKAYMMLGKLSAARHDPLAEQFYNSALALKPRSVEALYDKGIYCQDHGLDSLAVECYQRIMQIDTLNALAWYNSGYVRLEHLHDYNGAKRDLTHAIDLQPNYADAWYNRGVAMERSQQLDSAAANYEVCLSIMPGHSLAAESLDRLAKKGVLIKMKKRK